MSQLAADHGHDHGHDHHDHPPHVAHHFESMGQQFSSGKLGMWLFLATEILFFGGLFCAYTIYRANHPEIFIEGAKATDWRLGALNTCVLILSSVTMAWGVTAAQRGQKNLLMLMLALTFLGGVGFMGIKYIEYNHKMHEGLFWAGKYNPVVHEDPNAHAAPIIAPAADLVPTWNPYEGANVAREPSVILPAPAGPMGLSPLAVAAPKSAKKSFDAENAPQLTKVYFSIYYGMTGLHGIHVILGMGVIAWIFIRASRNEFGPNYFTPVDLTGLYWHLVDLIWIFLFPLLYLM